MAVLKSGFTTNYGDFEVASVKAGDAESGWNLGENYTYVIPNAFDYGGFLTEVDLTDFMEKLLEIEESVNSWFRGEIEIEDDTPSAGYVTLKYYTDEATPVLFKTVVVNKTTGARSQAT